MYNPLTTNSFANNGRHISRSH